MYDLAALREGLHIAFEEVYDQYHQKLYFFFLKHTGNRHMAEDLTQTAFMRLWIYRASLSDDHTLSEQLFRIAKTSLIDALRKHKKEKAGAKDYRYEAVTVPTFSFDVAHQLQKGMHAMPPVQQKVFRLSRVEGLSHKEIAAELSISTKSVEKHITKALKELKRVLLLRNY